MSEQPGRYQRSTSGMVGALIACLLVILAVAGLRACSGSGSGGSSTGSRHVDYLAEVGYAQQAGARLVYPARLPHGWVATNVDFTPGKRPGLALSMLTAQQEYVGVVQSPAPIPEVLTTYVDPQPTSGAAVTVPGSVVRRWATWHDSGGDTALVARRNGETVMVFGSAPQRQLEQVAASLTTKRL